MHTEKSRGNTTLARILMFITCKPTSIQNYYLVLLPTVCCNNKFCWQWRIEPNMLQLRSILHKFEQIFCCCKQNKIMATKKKFHQTTRNNCTTNQEWKLTLLCLASCMGATSQSQHLFCFVSNNLSVIIHLIKLFNCLTLSFCWIWCISFTLVLIDASMSTQLYHQHVDFMYGVMITKYYQCPIVIF